MARNGKSLSPRLALVLIAALFLFPLIAAWLMYSGAIGFKPADTRNLGILVEPAVPVHLDGLAAVDPARSPAAELPRHWSIVHALPDSCDRDCEGAVTALRQVHRAAGRDATRLHILLVQGANARIDTGRIAAIYPEFLLATDRDGRLLRELARIANAGTAAGNAYLLDPLGNIMMLYRAGYDPNDLKKDLDRLLTWSKLDEQT